MLTPGVDSNPVNVITVKNPPRPFPWRTLVFVLIEGALIAAVAYAAYAHTGSMVSYAFVIGAAALIAAWYSIAALVSSGLGMLAQVLLISTGLVLGFFFKVPRLELGIIWGILVVVLGIGAFRAKLSADNSVRFSALGSLAGSRGGALFALSIVLALCAAGPLLSYGSAQFSPRTLDWLTGPSEALFGRKYSGFSMDMTMDELFTLVMETQQEQAIPLGGNLTPEGANLNIFGQDLGAYANQILGGMEREARNAFLDRLSGMVGLNLKGSDTVRDVLYAFAQKQYDGLSASARNWVGKGLFVLVLASIMGIVNLVGFVFSFIEFLVLGALRAVRILRVSRITVEKELLSL